MSQRRTVITGMGIKSPVGNTIKSSWDNILNGRSGIARLEGLDEPDLTTQIAGQVRDFNIADFISPKDARRMDPFIHYGIAAAVDAISDSGLDFEREDTTRVGVAIGSGIGGIGTIENTHQTYINGGVRRVSPFFVPGTIINMISGHVSIMYGLRGPNIAVVTACTSANHNIGVAHRMIQYGDADVMVVGGAEFATTPTAMAGFGSAKALSTRNDDPESASRPWDRDRDGFVLSNGAGVMVIEELEHAKARGARIYAELTGFGMSGDAYHITAPSVGGAGAAQCMRSAIDDAGLNAEDIQYLNAHGTSTPAGDKAECMAVKTCFGGKPSLAVSSTKSMTGHLLGAAGGIEAIFSVLAIRDQIMPPTINLENPGEGCDLDFVADGARKAPLKHVLSNSFGFGGTNGTIAISRMD